MTTLRSLEMITLMPSRVSQPALPVVIGIRADHVAALLDDHRVVGDVDGADRRRADAEPHEVIVVAPDAAAEVDALELADGHVTSVPGFQYSFGRQRTIWSFTQYQTADGRGLVVDLSRRSQRPACASPAGRTS